MQQHRAGRKVNAPPNGGAGCYARTHCYAGSCTYSYPYAGSYTYRHAGPYTYPYADSCTHRYAGTDPAPNRCPCYPNSPPGTHRYPDAGRQDRRGVPERAGGV